VSRPEVVLLCNEAATGRRETDGVLKLRTSGAHRNVRLNLGDIGSTLNQSIPSALVDLLEIAAFVYIADQIEHRGAHDVESMGANWRRRLRFKISVRELALWRSEEMSAALSELLSFLSEDEYEFEFIKYERPPSVDSYLEFADYDDSVTPGAIALFSGGLDSLGGAVQQAVVDGEPSLFVTHESTPKLRNRLRTLRAMLDGAATGPAPQYVTVRVNKQDLGEREYTQRSRSFLYASLAAVVARMAGLNTIRFYENGVVSLNLPLSPQIVGSRATRTTHPKVLRSMERFFALVSGVDFAVENRFIWKTKADVVREIVDAGHGAMVPWSTSCTHTWEISNAKPHCGKCSQCIDRRFAVLAGGAGSFEKPETYGRDLIIDPRDAGESRIMLASYVETAQRVATMPEDQFFSQYGEAARALRHLGMDEDSAARKIVDLYRRHGQQVMQVVDNGIASATKAIRSRSLPDSCLIRLVHDPRPSSGDHVATPTEPVGDTAPDYQLLERGQGWVLRFDGVEKHLLPSIGLTYIRELISAPGRRFTLAELFVTARPQARGLPISASNQEKLDLTAAAAYHERLKELDAELDRANRDQAFVEAEVFKAEKDKLIAEIRRSNFKGRPKTESADHKRLRDRVRNAINRSVDTIGQYCEPAASHFRESITIGSTPVYDPSDQPPWEF